MHVIHILAKETADITLSDLASGKKTMFDAFTTPASRGDRHSAFNSRKRLTCPIALAKIMVGDVNDEEDDDDDDDEVLAKASKGKGRARAKAKVEPARRKVKKSTVKSGKAIDADDDDGDDNSKPNIKAKANVKPVKKLTIKSRKIVDEDDIDDVDEPNVKASKPAATTPFSIVSPIRPVHPDAGDLPSPRNQSRKRSDSTMSDGAGTSGYSSNAGPPTMHEGELTIVSTKHLLTRHLLTDSDVSMASNPRSPSELGLTLGIL